MLIINIVGWLGISRTWVTCTYQTPGYMRLIAPEISPLAPAITWAIMGTKRKRNIHKAIEAKAAVAILLKRTEKRTDNDIQKAPYIMLTMMKAKSLSISSAVGGTPIMRSPIPATRITMLVTNIVKVISPARNLPLITESR